MTTDKEQVAIKAVIDKAIAAGMEEGRLIWAIEMATNMLPVQLPLPDTPLSFGMTIMRETRGVPFPPNTTPEQMQAVEDYVRGRIRRYCGLSPFRG